MIPNFAFRSCLCLIAVGGLLAGCSTPTEPPKPTPVPAPMPIEEAPGPQAGEATEAGDAAATEEAADVVATAASESAAAEAGTTVAEAETEADAAPSEAGTDGAKEGAEVAVEAKADPADPASSVDSTANDSEEPGPGPGEQEDGAGVACTDLVNCVCAMAEAAQQLDTGGYDYGTSCKTAKSYKGEPAEAICGEELDKFKEALEETKDLLQAQGVKLPPSCQ